MNGTFAEPMSNQLRICWIITSIALFVFFGFRFTGMNAVVMADEWYYSSLSRLTAPAAMSIPSYLYTSIYHATTACGDGYLDCARRFNAFFFVGSAPFIYLVGRNFLSARLASFVALLTLLGPVNSYTAYYMPESFYFFAFWVTTWAAFRFAYTSAYVNAAVLGACVGALALVKLHALFLIPSIATFMLYGVARAKTGTNASMFRVAAVSICLMLVVAATVRFGFGYLVAGKSGLNLSGSLYSAQAGNSTGQHQALVQLAQMSLFNLRGHISALIMLFGVPIAALVAQPFQSSIASEPTHPRALLAVYTALIMLALLGMTVAFTAFVAGSGYESNLRLHMRYYNFALPLLVMFAATFIGCPVKLSTPAVVLIGVTLVAVIVLAAVTMWQPYQPSLVDSPEFRGMTTRRATFHILSALSLLGVLVWIRSRDIGARIFLFTFMPLFAIAASTTIQQEVRSGGATNNFDRAGIAVHQALTPKQRDKLAIVGTDVSGMFRSQFHIDSIVARQYTPAPRTLLNLTDMTGAAWLLLLADYPIPVGATIRVQGDGYALVELAPTAK